MKRLLLVGDPHITPQSIPYMGRMLREFLPTLFREQSCDHVVVMGDLYDNHRIANIEVREFWGSVLASWRSQNIPCTLISGNHDADQDCRWSWVRHHENIPMVHVVTTPGSTELARGVFAMPYVRQNSEFVAAMRQLPADAKFLLCHQEFVGCDYGNGHFSKLGVSTDDVPTGLTVVSGHIHKKQALFRDGRMVVLYVGSSRQVSRAEEGNATSLLTLDVGSGQFVQHEVPEEVVPRFRTVRVTSCAEVEKLPAIPASHLTIRVGDGNQTAEDLDSILRALPAGSRTIVERPKRAVTVAVTSEPVRRRLERYADAKGLELGLSEMERVRLLEVLSSCLPQTL